MGFLVLAGDLQALHPCRVSHFPTSRGGQGDCRHKAIFLGRRLAIIRWRFDDRRLTLFLIRLVLYIGLVVLAWSVLFLSVAGSGAGRVGIVVAFLLDPSVRALENRRAPRWLAVGGMVLVFLGFLTLIATTLPYLVSRESITLPSRSRPIKSCSTTSCCRFWQGVKDAGPQRERLRAPAVRQDRRVGAGGRSDPVAVGSALPASRVLRHLITVLWCRSSRCPS